MAERTSALSSHGQASAMRSQPSTFASGHAPADDDRLSQATHRIGLFEKSLSQPLAPPPVRDTWERYRIDPAVLPKAGEVDDSDTEADGRIAKRMVSNIAEQLKTTRPALAPGRTGDLVPAADERRRWSANPQAAVAQAADQASDSEMQLDCCFPGLGCVVQ